VPHVHEPDLEELLLHPLGDVAGGQVRLLAQGEGDVVEDRHRVEERPALEDDAVAPADRLEGGAAELGDVDAVHEHGARVRPQEPEQVLEQHRLAATAPADDDLISPVATSRSTPEAGLAAEGTFASPECGSHAAPDRSS
jgi:hypothetical protein